MTVNDLDTFLTANNMALGSGTVISDLTIGGAVAAGCHGTGKGYSIMSDFVTEMRIVDSNGILQTYSGLILNTVKVNLGLFGIIYDVVLQVEPNRNVNYVAQTLPYTSVITGSALQSFFNNYDSLEIYYFPFASSVQVRTSHATTAASTFNYTLYVESGLETVQIGLEYAPYFEADPTLLYETGSSGFDIFASVNDTRPLEYAVHYGYGIQGGPPFFNPEYVFPLNNNLAGFQAAANAINDTVTMIYNYYFQQGLAPVTYGLNIRFTKSTQSLLSPANTNTQYVMWMDILLGVNAAGTTQFMSDIYNLLTTKYTAVPHWPKDWNQIPNTQNFNIGLFLAYRNFADADATNIFVNDALSRLFVNKFAPYL